MVKSFYDVEKTLGIYNDSISRFGIQPNMTTQEILTLHEYLKENSNRVNESEFAYFSAFFGAVAAQLFPESRLLRIASNVQHILPYELARAFMEHVWYVRVQQDWTVTYNQEWGSMRPLYIPGNPHTAYRGQGWRGWADFLNSSDKSRM